MRKTEQKSVKLQKTILNIEPLIWSIVSKYNMAQPEEVKKECNKLLLLINESSPDSVKINLEPIFTLLQKRSGLIAEHIFSFLEETAKSSQNPLPVVKAILRTRDKNLALRALSFAVQLAETKSLVISRTFIKFLAKRLSMEKTPFAETDAINNMISLVKFYKCENELEHKDILLELYLYEENLKIRQFVAQLLDKSAKSITHKISEIILGKNVNSFFLTYIDYTRATYSDLLCFKPSLLKSLMNDFSEAKKIIGDKLLNEIIAKLGWNRINYGLQVQAFTGVSIDNSPQFMVSELEANLLEKCSDAERISKTYLVTACGGMVNEDQNEEDEKNPISRFRAFNLIHASLLRDFLDVNPINKKKIHSIIDRMDQIVDDYVTLFTTFSDECSILPGVYKELKTKILNELIENRDQPQLSANLTRLVQSFEEPHSLGEVTTLHGLKRYLHQHSLKLGFRLVERSKNPNRTIDLLVAHDDSIEFVLNKIRFADFEPEQNETFSTQNIPFSVKLLLDGFSRQILHGHEQFPHVNIYCYGNEVHYYFGFRNHPVLLRIDYAPPLQGGMIDIEYFGVSNYEIEQHPNISLDVIRTFFQRMEFEVKIEGTHIHARYDKERALNLGDLRSKAKLIFRLLPYFMDLDWIAGSLGLEKGALHKLANAWSNFFISWGFLPLKNILTKEKTSILTGYVDEPIGRREKIWSGEGSYEDIFTGRPNAEFYKELLNIVHIYGFDNYIQTEKGCNSNLGQIELEECLLKPLRQAITCGELIKKSGIIKPQLPSLFLRVHEAELFADILIAGFEQISKAISTARIIRPLERIITFNTSGSINGYEVQKAILTLRNEEICFFILRGIDGIIKLAFFTRAQNTFKKRKSISENWISNANFNVTELATILRANNYLDNLSEFIGHDDSEEANQFLKEINQNILLPENEPLRGERIITGLKASPGRSVGKAIFGTERKNPQDFQGSILVASSLKPEDANYLYYADGIVSTGGGILSHAGLIAMQYKKPSIIITGKWQTDSGQKMLVYKSLEYKIIQKKMDCYNVCIRNDIKEKEFVLREGDLLLLDAIAGNIRILGQERNVLALNEGFRLYRKANEMLSTAKKENEILNLRGKLLRARHQLENVLRRCANPITARYAIFEILLNETSSNVGMVHRDKVILLSILLNNKLLETDTKQYLLLIMNELKSNYLEVVRKAEKEIPNSNYPYEIITLRLEVIHHQIAIESVKKILVTCNMDLNENVEYGSETIETEASERLSFLQQKLTLELQNYLNKKVDDFSIRHILHQLESINSILKIDIKENSTFNSLQEKLIESDNQKRKIFANNYIIKSSECGFELFNQIGWKAANLAEIEKLNEGEYIPPWFVVTDQAFKELLDATGTELKGKNGNLLVKENTLREAINKIIVRDDLNARQKSTQISGLWERVQIPESIRKEILLAYKNIILDRAGKNNTGKEIDKVYVAVRSSSREEDTEAASRAGEFETYLYIQGEDQLLKYLKLTWSGLWTEQAIQHRAILGSEFNQAGGGVIIQRIVNSRVSGVLQTVDIPRSTLREMVINAALGMGEGLVSGTIAADQITVSKETDLENEPLRFSYITSDKTEQIIFNKRSGYGTIRTQTLYHQRLRPALEYVELHQLVSIATSLEKKYGYPLDIEFGIEGSKLWILQVRPVSLFLSIINETNERFPIKTKS